MTKINKDYLYTEEWDELDKIKLESNALYLYANDPDGAPEARSVFCAKELSRHNPQTTFSEIKSLEDDTICIVDKEDTTISLHSTQQIGQLLSPYQNSTIYIEVTGLSCRIAAPLMKYAMEKELEIRIIYTEPSNYKLEAFCKMGIHKDLCETVDGINPLPGLAHLLPHRESPLFVVLLGFEGGRFSQIIQNQTPDNDKITPVLGVPGYKIDYPYISMWGNRHQIKNTGCWQNLKYAEANSIVDIYMKLAQLRFDFRDPEMIIAPIGTKPHAIGAILYSIKYPNKVEIVYDNPKRSVNRTEGIGKISVCNITKLFKEN